VSRLAVLNANDWRMAFERHEDRIRHRIEVEAADGWRSLTKSVEGTADQWWPASPPLQNLHVETREGRDVVLLVGMAGRSHWSASVGISADGAEIVFDLACRAAAEPDWLGSRYRLGFDRTPDSATEVREHRLTLTATDVVFNIDRREVWFRSLDANPLSVACYGPDEFTIAALPADETWPQDQRWPQTIRWRYAVRVGARDAPGKPGA
jgi:hypothetical protein